MGLCPSRNSAALKSSEKVSLTSGKATNVNKVKTASMVRTPAALPTQSWRALLKDAPLKAGPAAQGFKPQSITARDVFTAANPSGAFTGLSKLANKDSKPLDPRFRTKVLFSKSLERSAADEPVSTLGATTIVDTSAYMQLLREGASKKKTAKPHAAPKSVATKRDAPPGLSLNTDLRGQVAMTAAGFQVQWPGGLKNFPGQGEGKEQDEPRKVIHDDLQIERLNADIDLSDPAYWSETESIHKDLLQGVSHDTAPALYRIARSRQNNPSAHRFGRRAKCSEVRSYVMQDLNFTIDETVAMLLLRLQRFNEQQQVLKQEASGQRRFCIGLKEVARRVKQSKVSCLIVAPDLEADASEGGLDDRVREILGAAYEKNIPVIFALSRARIGEAMGKHVPISVLGVLDGTGAQCLLETSVKLAQSARESWLARISLK